MPRSSRILSFLTIFGLALAWGPISGGLGERASAQPFREPMPAPGAVIHRGGPIFPGPIPAGFRGPCIRPLIIKVDGGLAAKGHLPRMVYGGPRCGRPAF